MEKSSLIQGSSQGQNELLWNHRQQEWYRAKFIGFNLAIETLYLQLYMGFSSKNLDKLFIRQEKIDFD